tara:strand:- start:425 stop:535 length:111 start_codon:yes stop_codon:yes gene_type:complete
MEESVVTIAHHLFNGIFKSMASISEAFISDIFPYFE